MKKVKILGQKDSTLSNDSISMQSNTIKKEDYRSPDVKEISTNYSSKRKVISLGCWNCGGSESGAAHC